MSADALLAVKELNAWYGESHILHGVEFEVRQGEVVTLLGRNGAGKTTTLKSVMGMVGRREGSIAFEGRETIALASNRIARLGIAFCPEERGIFASLNVLENLLLPPAVREGGLGTQQVYELFPNLKERSRACHQAFRRRAAIPDRPDTPHRRPAAAARRAHRRARPSSSSISAAPSADQAHGFTYVVEQNFCFPRRAYAITYGEWPRRGYDPKPS